MTDRLRRVAIALAVLLAPVSEAIAQASSSPSCTVARVVDGDTLVCMSGERIRLLMIDAPEMDQGPFGRAAQAFLEALLPPGSEARLETDVERRDRYGRLLAHVRRHDGRLVNRLMVRQGFAVPYVVPPDVRHVEAIRAAADTARAMELGLWAIAAFECPPEAFRGGACGAAAAPRAARALSAQGAGCDPSYPDVCIPPPPPDLDCPDVPHRRFRVTGADPHRFDGNRDGVGCEGAAGRKRD